MYGGYSYIELGYEPKRDAFIVLLWLKGKGKLERLAESVASESSIGTWTKLQTMNNKVFKDYRARIFKIIKVTENSGFVFIAYPWEHFDQKNVLQFFAGVLGNLFGLKELEECYILDINFPKKYQKQFSGPEFGMRGIRKYIGTLKNRRPHVGTIVKPKVGLTPKQFSEVAYKSWMGGLDLVKDDENLVDQKFCPWVKRFDMVTQVLDKAEQKTGEKKLYATNITDSNINRMLERVDYVKESGMKMVMLDVYILGVPALLEMLKATKKAKLFVHAHRAGYAAHHRGSFGVNFGVYEKFWRMFGVDQLHIGAGVGKMEGGALLIHKFHEIAQECNISEKLYLGSLGQKWIKDIKSIFSVASGGMDPGRIDAAIVVHGRDVVIQAGGGVHGHPGGTLAGAKAMRQAADAVVEGVPAVEYAKTHKELEQAINSWGYVDPKKIVKKFEYEENHEKQLNELILKKGMKGIRRVWSI